MAARRPNRHLAEAIAEANVSNKDLARRVADLARRDDHPISPDHVSVRRWLDGVMPQGRTPHYIALALSTKLGRRVSPADIGFDDTGITENTPAPGVEYPDDATTAVDMLAKISSADLSGDPSILHTPWASEATPGLISGFLFGQMSPDIAGTSEIQSTSDLSPADAIRATASHLMDLDFRFGGGHVRRLLLFYFNSEVVPLLRGHLPSRFRSDIFCAAAEVAELLGWSAYDAGRFGAAQRYYAQALRLAREAGDELLGGWMLASLSHQANYLGRYSDAIQLARASYAATQGKAGVTVTCLSLAMEARALASLGDSTACTRAIHRAEQLFERQNLDDDPPWIAFFNAEELAGESAHCYMNLGRSAETRIFGEQALDPRNTPPRTRAFIGMVNATGALHGGSLDEAISIASGALSLGVHLQSRRYRRYVSDFSQAIIASHPKDARTSKFLGEVKKHYPEIGGLTN